MIEIIVIVGVIVWFARAAMANDKNGFLWGFIGAISYYGPILLVGRLIYPMIIKGRITHDNMVTHMIVGTLLNIIVGIGCCWLAYKLLLSRKVDNSSRADLHSKTHLVGIEEPTQAVTYLPKESTRKPSAALWTVCFNICGSLFNGYLAVLSPKPIPILTLAFFYHVIVGSAIMSGKNWARLLWFFSAPLCGAFTGGVFDEEYLGHPRFGYLISCVYFLVWLASFILLYIDGWYFKRAKVSKEGEIKG